MRLRQFHADGPAADDDEMPGQFRLFENGFVGEIGNRFKTGYRREGRSRAGRNHEAPGRVTVAGNNRLRPELCVGLNTPGRRAPKRSTESLGAMEAMTDFTCAMNLLKLTCGSAAEIP